MAKAPPAPKRAALTDDTILVITNCTRSPYTRPTEKGEIVRPEHRMEPGGTCTIRKGFHDQLMKASKPYAALVGKRKLVVKEDPMLVESPTQLHNAGEPQMPADLKESPVVETVNGPKGAEATTTDVAMVDAPDDGVPEAPKKRGGR